METTIGIDVSKSKVDVALICKKGFNNKIFENNFSGFVKLYHWLKNRAFSEMHICLEATGGYEEALATYLFEKGIKISVVNPARIKGFAKTQLSRTKTDKADAKLIAQFCQIMRPNAWQPTPEHIKILQAYVKRLDVLLDLQNQERNRLEGAHSAVKKSIQAILNSFEKQIQSIKENIHTYIQQHDELRKRQDLLRSINGIGETTIAKVLAFLHHIESFKSAKQIVAFVGLNPKQHQSGSSVRGKSLLSKTGDAQFRRALYFPAIVAMRYNLKIKVFSERLKASGKPMMVIICAAMRKLIHIIYGVLKSGEPFCGSK